MIPLPLKHFAFRQPSSARKFAPALFSFILLLVSIGSLVAAQTQRFFRLADVKPGLHGIGRTVFSGNRVEEFQVEILGLLNNISPKQVIILARLSGGPLAQTGILQGMSGSPVYIDGKLLGAVALGFPFSKEPIAGIQPIEQMISESSLDASPASPRLPPPSQVSFWQFYRHGAPAFSNATPPESPVTTPFGRLTPLGIPLSFSGFTAATLQTLSAGFEGLGFQPAAALAGQTGPTTAIIPPSQTIIPGSMISVGLLTGDLNMTADGTVTYVAGKRVYAFGHRFLDIGSVEMPFAHSEVIALIPNLNSSFKLSAPQAWVGSILSDRASAVSGEIGRSAHTIPLEVNVHSSSTGDHAYKFQVVNDRFLTPFVTQAALFSVLDATERTVGRGTLQLSGHVEWDQQLPPLDITGTFVSDSGLVQQASSDAVVPLGFVLGAGFGDIHLKKITYRLEANESKQQLHLAQAWTSTHNVHPGDTLQIHALLEGENGFQMSRTLPYQIPSGAPVGPINLTLSDGNTLNYPEFAGLSQSSSHSAADLIRTINSFRDNDALYVRVWRPQPSFTISSPTSAGELDDPPPSVALVLSDPSNSATSNAGLALVRGSELDQLSLSTHGFVVTGAKTLQVEVKE